MRTNHPVERERLRRAVANMLDSLVTREATPEQLTAWAEVVEHFAGQVRDDPPESVFWGVGGRSLFAAKGLLEPAGFAPSEAQAGDTFTATLTFGPDQEGHRGLAHGGSIAQAFDYLLGIFEIAGTRRPFTSELNVRFLKPVPLRQPVTFEATVDSVEGSRRRVSARALIGGVAHAEADGVIVVKLPAAQ